MEMIISGKFVIQPQHRDAFLDVLNAFQPTGASIIQLSEDINTPNTFYMFTEFPDRETAEAIEKTEVPEFMGKIGLFLAETPKFAGYHANEKIIYME